MNQFTVALLVLFACSFAHGAVPSISGFHFHSYYFKASQRNIAVKFHEMVKSEIHPNGQLANCIIGRLADGPVGPHPIAQFVTCCNATALPNAIGYFMKARDQMKLPVLLHPLTKSELADHSTRAMWMGPKIPLDLTYMPETLHSTPICPSNW